MGHEHSTHSVLREIILEHLFVGRLLQRLWQAGIFDAEILHSKFDAGGYDLVLNHGQITRHIQLKALISGGKRRNFDIHTRLGEQH